MAPSLRLREYQREGIDACDAAQAAGLRRFAVVWPTGAGKTVAFAELVRRAVVAGKRPMILVHRDELVTQAVDKIHSAAPDHSVGIVKAARSETDADIIVASVQTLARPARRAAVIAARDTHLIIVDESHHAAAKSYIDVLTDFGCFDPERDTIAIGFTATMSREDDRHLGDVWQKIVHEKDILWMIEHGYLVDPRGHQVTVDGLDLATVARRRGDYVDGELGTAMEDSGAGTIVATAYRTHATREDGTLMPGIMFAPTVSAAHTFAADFNAAGITTEVVVGTTPLEDRALIYKRFRHGDTQVLSSVGVLTEGFDAPWATVAVIARPTSSTGLYKQMVGRVLRPFPGKDEAVVLDVVGISDVHDLASISVLTHSQLPNIDGASLTQRAAAGREEDERVRTGRYGGVEGKIASRAIDLFHTSKSAWLRTRGGVWFIATKFSTWFLWPDKEGDDEHWKVGKCGVRTTKGGTWPYRGLTLEYAMAWAEQEAETEDATVASRTSAWRRTKPSEQQIAMGLRLGVQDAATYRKGALSDAISTVIASRLLDVHKKG